MLSPIGVEPNSDAINCSRTRPNMREINVQKATMTPERNNVTVYFCVLFLKSILLHGYHIIIASDCREYGKARGNKNMLYKLAFFTGLLRE
ncbi:hypothetical protein RCA_01795 [Rickettsia canadensis str. CA410]|uniref:Uncharacterized protein n=1 Tax=Rickettsia canadensis str. CA410 TaxID=1105107 RepID=A0ABN4AAK7_RICCA|nr:hypothetical protein RCA_01795 [Rickettsia canadensis str. CA410]